MNYVFDVEADGLLEEATKIHVLSYQNIDDREDKGSLFDYDDIIRFLADAQCLIGHNIVLYDIPVLEKLLGIKVEARLVDTLPLAWYLYPHKRVVGLDAWGEEFRIFKPKVDDWNNLSREEYAHRCQEDVKINTRLWKNMASYLSQLYETDNPLNLRIVKYLTFKMECAKLQGVSKWLVDKELVNNTLAELYEAQNEKVIMLKGIMPNVPIMSVKNKPAKPFKKDGSLSSHGDKWFAFLSEMGLDKNTTGPISYISGWKEPNPNSPDQLKKWLFDLGWEPETFKYVKDDDGEERSIPQIRVPHSGGELCPSVLRLVEDNPDLEHLTGLSIIQHRIGVLEGFLKESDEDGCVIAQINGLTNTLRFKHKSPVVNLPGRDKKWGKEIRSSLIAKPGYILCGADMVSLEATTKRHYMYPYDPEYADFMGQDGFDEHLDLAVVAGVITQEDYKAHINKEKDFSAIRKMYKPVNYSAIYGIGPPKLARDIKKPVWEAQQLLDIYWQRNAAIKQVVEDLETKTINGQKWLFNPISRFWYSLRYDKDKFSTLNQGSGSYCFDTWVSEVIKRRKQMTAQFHDEGVWELKKGNEAKMEQLLLDSIKATNDKLKLNVELKISIQFGQNYGDIH